MSIGMNIHGTVSKKLAPYKRIAVWGLGGGGECALKHYLPREKVALLVDAKRQIPCMGLPVIDPDDADFENIDCVVVCTSAYLEVFDKLMELSVKASVMYFDALLCDAAASGSQLAMLRVDAYRQQQRGLLKLLARQPQFLVNVTYRVARALSLKSQLWWRPLAALARLAHGIACVAFSISLPVSVDAGPGLVFPHYGSVVIHPDAVIGTCCTIYQCTTIGSNDSGGRPRLGNFVTVYPFAGVIGKSEVGDHTRVGMHTLAADMIIPAGSTVVGIPGRVVRRSRAVAEEILSK